MSGAVIGQICYNFAAIELTGSGSMADTNFLH